TRDPRTEREGRGGRDCRGRIGVGHCRGGRRGRGGRRRRRAPGARLYARRGTWCVARGDQRPRGGRRSRGSGEGGAPHASSRIGMGLAPDIGAEAPLDRSYRALFAIPAIPRIIFAMTMARLASSMVSVAVILFSLTRYNSPVLTGIVTFASL